MKALNEKNAQNGEGRYYRDQLVTFSDLESFKEDIVAEFRKIARELMGQPGKKWLKSYEVKKLLGISPGTLQNLRLNGTLPFAKIGGVILYDYADIQRMIDENKKASDDPYLYGVKIDR